MCLTSELHEEEADSESTKKGDHSCYEKILTCVLCASAVCLCCICVFTALKVPIWGK